MLIARTPVRISFAGGGTDFPGYYEKYGGAVLSATINKYFYTILTARQDDLIQVISSDIKVTETWQQVTTKAPKENTELEIPLAVIRWLPCEIGLNLFLASEIPPGTGLGSSAAVCVNLLHILSRYMNRPFSSYSLAEDAFHIAREILKKPVGKQDEYAASFGGLNFIRFNATETEVERLSLSPGALRELADTLVLFYTGASHDSWTILKDQEESSSRSEGSSINAHHALRELAFEMKEVLVAEDFTRFGLLLDRGWQQKKLLSSKISNPRIDGLYELGKQHGALGGKITGAGGGGFLLFYCEREKKPGLIEAMKGMGLREMHFNFDQAGSQVVYNDPFFEEDPRGGTQWVYMPAGSVAGGLLQFQTDKS
jgi:D-glycero-alpha-D-manno-heptose-7-phosphate kinase